MQFIQSRIHSQIRDPARSLNDRALKPLKRLVAIAKRRVNDAYFISEQTFIASGLAQVANHALGFATLPCGSQRVTESRDHNGIIGGYSCRIFQCSNCFIEPAHSFE